MTLRLLMPLIVVAALTVGGPRSAPRTWFTDADSKEIAGAYYFTVRCLP